MATPDSPEPGGSSIEVRADAVRLGLSAAGILALELAVIRWMSGQIRIFAYFNNLILLAAFLGIGLGLGLGVRRPELRHGALPALAALGAILGFAPQLQLAELRFPDPAISLWGSEGAVTLGILLHSTLVFLVLFWCVTGVFLCAGSAVGWYFSRLPALAGYSADLTGSLLGIVAATIAASLRTPPPVWIAVGAIPLLAASPTVRSGVAAAIAIALAFVSIGGARFSAYNRIDVNPGVSIGRGAGVRMWEIRVNRDFHQHVLDLSDAALARPAIGQFLRPARLAYDLPFRLAPSGGRALVVGAGTGNDVAAGLRAGYREIVAVDIDATLLDLGRRLHPERPYSDPRVHVIVNDARAYFEQNRRERFDLVCYGLLDSHAMFSAMSSLRLDNFVYTVEGIRAGWEHVAPGGLLAISFSGDWIAPRMAGILRAATGLEPVVVALGSYHAMGYFVGREISAARVAVAGFEPVTVAANVATRIPTDDWPYLYLKPGVFPYAYVVILALVLVSATAAVHSAFGLRRARAELPLFWMGAAFMLLETRMVTQLGLIFGSTWIVNAGVFFAILLTALAANRWVRRNGSPRLTVAYGLLGAALLLTWSVSAGSLNRLPLPVRGVAGGLLYAFPLVFAGVIFSTLLERSREPATALGCNLLGAVFGGALEYLSMVMGLRALILLTLALYAASAIALHRLAAVADRGRSEAITLR